MTRRGTRKKIKKNTEHSVHMPLMHVITVDASSFHDLTGLTENDYLMHVNDTSMNDDYPAPEWMNDVLNETNDVMLILMNYDDSTDYCRKIADNILLSRWTPSGEPIPSNIHITTL